MRYFHPMSTQDTYQLSITKFAHSEVRNTCTRFNIQNEPVTVTIDYIENTEALGALLALMYLDQDGNIVCNQLLQ